MPYDYLNTTTYGSQLAQQQDMMNYMQQAMAAQQQQELSDYEPIDDSGYGDDLVEVSDDRYNDEEEQDTNPLNPLHEQELDDVEEGYDPINEYLFAPSEDMTTVNTVQPQNFSLRVRDKLTPGLDWLRTKTDNVNLSGVNTNISKYLNTLPENLRTKLLATSGNDDKHAPGSAHYSGNAIDFRYSPEVYKYITSDPLASKMGLKVLDPNHGTAPHIHLQSRQYGGHVNATTDQELSTGLNDKKYNTATLNLIGSNTIRGLDNNQPVAVTDGSKYRVLYGSQDTDTFHGKVYESRL